MIELANLVIKFKDGEIKQALMEIEDAKHVARSPYLTCNKDRIKNYFIKYETNPINQEKYESFAPHTNGLIFIDVGNKNIHMMGEKVFCHYYDMYNLLSEFLDQRNLEEGFHDKEDLGVYQFIQNFHANALNEIEMMGNPMHKIKLEQFKVPSLQFSFNIENMISQVFKKDLDDSYYIGKSYIKNGFNFIKYYNFNDEMKIKEVLKSELPWSEKDDYSFTIYMIN